MGMAPQQRKVLLFKDLSEEGYAEEATRPRRHESKRGVVKVPSLLFDIELEDNAVEESKDDDDVHEVLRQLKSLVQPWNAVEVQLQQQVQAAVKAAATEGVKLDAHQLARRLDLPGYTFKVRTALGGGWSGDCLRQLRHFFLTCVVPGSLGPVSYVIDPCFREQFEIATPTKQYSSILAELPREFIGTEERISALVNLLSNEIKRSFQETGATLPPWRHPASMLSKWRPRRSEDISVAPSRPSQASRLSMASDGKDACANVKVDISASSSIDDVAATIAEGGGSRKLGVAAQVSVCSPPMDFPALASKRGRELGPGSSKCSSLLAAKLRGVSSYGARSATRKGQA